MAIDGFIGLFLMVPHDYYPTFTRIDDSFMMRDTSQFTQPTTDTFLSIKNEFLPRLHNICIKD